MLKLGLWMVLFMATSACATDYVDKRETSSHFKDGEFKNLEAGPQKSFWKFLKMRMKTEWSDWPDWREISVAKKIKNKNEADFIEVTPINHSTFLIQYKGLNILTDPIYSDRCSPVQFAGPKRVHKPGINFKDLPQIDLIIISHDHYDHLDLDTIESLVKRDSPNIFLGLGVGERLESMENVSEMDWWDKAKFSEELTVNFVPVQHFSGRTLTDRNSTLWGGFVLEFKDKKIYFGGDSGYASHYNLTYEKFGKMDLAFLPIGAYAPRSFMKYAHMDPTEAIQAHKDLRAKQSIGMHYGTFQLTAEKIDEPVKLLKKELEKQKIESSDFLALKYGQSYQFK